ncbi:unnamed protein product [Penicillium salamii]|nr:unnamed protein product [Penicillium salamii]
MTQLTHLTMPFAPHTCYYPRPIHFAKISRVIMYGLPTTTPMFQFHGEEQSSRVLDQELNRYELTGKDPYVIITSVEERSFLEYFTKSCNDILRKPCVSYYDQHSIVLVEMESEVHATGCGSFKTIIDTWVHKSKSLVCPTGSAMFRGVTRWKKAECSWKPAELPSGRNPKWPSMAVDVRYSEPVSHLMNDVCFWLDESNGDVNIVLTVSISGRHKISIEKWSLHHRRSQEKPIPFPTAKIEIAKGPERASRPKITGNITILFEDMFLRPKMPTENDLTLSRPDLERMALQIWAVQD